ncbi:MAG: hypothetical protein IPP38_10080 [Bacteroidetes bacterium]|nr:hypothetical protein [Bacteroidota bacterium]
MLSPDSFTNELEEKAYVRDLVNRDPDLYNDPSNAKSLSTIKAHGSRTGTTENRRSPCPHEPGKAG